MTKAPKKPDSRAKALAGMTKPELVKTIKTLDSRVTKLLNQAERLKRTLRAAEEPYTPQSPELDALDRVGGNDVPHRMPWEQE